MDVLADCWARVAQALAAGARLHTHLWVIKRAAGPLQMLLELPANDLSSVLPPDSSCEAIEVDTELSFLNSYVAEALAHGAAPYVPEAQRRGKGLEPPLASSRWRVQSYASLRIDKRIDVASSVSLAAALGYLEMFWPRQQNALDKRAQQFWEIAASFLFQGSCGK